MSINRTPVFPEVITTDAITFANADGVAAKALSTPGVNGRNIYAIVCTSNDTAAAVANLSILKGGITYPIGQSAIPIGAGTNNANKAVNLLNSVDATYLKPDGSLDLANGAVLQVNMTTAVTAAKNINVVAFGGDY
jgi:hypothetical protein